jgi:replicative DNA helicase
MYKINKGDLDNADFSKMGDAMEKLSSGNRIFIDDHGGLTVPILKSKLRKLKIEQKGLDLVIIDYLQLMHATTFIGNRTQEISEISRGLKEMAKELGVPVIALSQLSRAVESRVDKKPQLSDLRESGAIEQDADIVAALHAPDTDVPQTDDSIPSPIQLIILKHRNGPTATIDMLFKKKTSTFLSLKKDGGQNEK